MSPHSQTPPKANPAATIRDVAREAGVSVATVSRFVNQTHKVSPEVAQRLEAAMKLLDYVPHVSARNLATRRTFTIGVLMEYIAGEFFGPLLNGIEEECFATGYSLSIASTHRLKTTHPESSPTLGPHSCDGVIVVSNALPDIWLRRWHKAAFPMVLAYQSSPDGIIIPSVGVENEQAVKNAVLHMIRKHGRKRVLFLKGFEAYEDARTRESGYRSALSEAGIGFDPELVLAGDFNTSVAHRSVKKALERGLRFDAIYAADDDSAFGALEALKNAGIKVPQEVSLMGFDDLAASARSNPPLSTISAPTLRIGKLAAQTLVQLLEGKTVPERVVLDTKIHFRESCGC